jgi:hypothetical protein
LKVSILDVGTYPGKDFKSQQETYQPVKHVGHEQIIDWAQELRAEYKDVPGVIIRSITDGGLFLLVCN